MVGVERGSNTRRVMLSGGGTSLAIPHPFGFLPGAVRPGHVIPVPRVHHPRLMSSPCPFPARPCFISGASRGIGLGDRQAGRGRRQSRDTAFGSPRARQASPQSCRTRDQEEIGGRHSAIVGDIRDGDVVVAAVGQGRAAVQGNIDICVNNASAIDLARSPRCRCKTLRPDERHQVRGTRRVAGPASRTPAARTTRTS